MNFEKAYENYIAGNASDEEKAFVEGEVAKAKKLNEIIDAIDNKKEVIAPSEMQDVRRAQKKHTVTNTIRTLLIVIGCLLVTAGAICGGVFGQAISSANKNEKYSTEAARQIATEFVKSNYTTNTGAVIVTKVDKELKISGNLKHSSYVYYIEVQNGSSVEIELAINARTGLVTLIDID